MRKFGKHNIFQKSYNNFGIDSKNLIINSNFALTSTRTRRATSLHVFEFLLQHWQNIAEIVLQGQHCAEHKLIHFGPGGAVVEVQVGALAVGTHYGFANVKFMIVSPMQRCGKVGFEYGRVTAQLAVDFGAAALAAGVNLNHRANPLAVKVELEFEPFDSCFVKHPFDWPPQPDRLAAAVVGKAVPEIGHQLTGLVLTVHSGSL